MRVTRVRLAVALVLVLACTAACGDADSDGGDTRIRSYAALGDSYTSAPGVPVTDLAAGCMRSDRNYPAILAAELGVPHVDVSCSGAQTVALHEPQLTGNGVNPPQLKAVKKGTDLVTAGFGLNDLGLSSSLLVECVLLAPTDPLGSPCRDSMATPDGDRLAGVVQDIGPRVRTALNAVRTRAPDARLVLVGYPQLVPPTGTCPELPLAEEDYPYVRGLLEDLGRTMEQAADAAGAVYVDLLVASTGHDICAGEEAWIKGAGDDPARALSYHPFVEEQEVVAGLIREALADQSSRR